MATKFSNALQMTNSSDALFRAWAQFIFDTFVTVGGWVQTADTGQVTISTMTHPGLASTQVGYQVWRMADTLQSTKPCFMRVAFGSGGAANTPLLTVTVGQGSDGAGNITNVLMGPILVTSALNAASGTNSYGSADTNRGHLMMFVRNAATDSLLFSIERTHDATTGADTGDGFLVTYQDTTPGTLTLWVNWTFGPQPAGERWSLVLSNQATSSFGSNTGIAFPLHFKGFVQPVALGVIVTNSGDFLAAAQPTLTVYGTLHQYQLADSATSAHSIATGNGGTTSRSNSRFGIRYE
jgi:hypothetical protein